ncbi:MAG TPA: hypothetical protein VGM88_13370 [Kofleriaceae bacterium]|jgi:uncharacterized membrane protein
MRSWLSAALLVAACGTEPAAAPPTDAIDSCSQSYLTYENFGAPFVSNWCRGCHSAALAEDQRQMAPLDVNFDSQLEVDALAADIRTHATGAAADMPPAGGPSDDERSLLAEWLSCGAP